ncbi:hypothetical protein [Lacrimispora sp.]|uniref:hypothetical protein n=1 Tax=Lacrimispora sp. TaxID=2719234 RepID=UPI0028A8B72A|nr:hypothetical protein [Lacrimispora sp.]
MQRISDKCNRESCRFCEDGRCTDQEQRNECLDLLNQIIPLPDDRITFALSDQGFKVRVYKLLGLQEYFPRY